MAKELDSRGKSINMEINGLAAPVQINKQYPVQCTHRYVALGTPGADVQLVVVILLVMHGKATGMFSSVSAGIDDGRPTFRPRSIVPVIKKFCIQDFINSTSGCCFP